MKYTAKHVCRLFGISREALRYYEKEGLLHPEIDQNNRYRYYDDWEINYILEIIQYRNLGFSIEQIRSLIERDSLKDYEEKLLKRKAEIEEKIAYQSLILEKNEEFLRHLRLLKKRIGTYELVWRPAFYSVPLRRKEELYFEKPYSQLYPAIIKDYEFFKNILCIPLDDYLGQTGGYTWGFAIKKHWADRLHLDLAGSISIPEQLCIRTVIDAGDRWDFSYDLFADTMQFITANKLELDGDIYGLLQARVHEGKHYSRYIETYLPVRQPQ